MKKSYIIIAVVVILIFIVCGKGCSSYNNLVTMDEEINNKWAQVENQYQRRLDLIPNLVASVKGYATHEKETYTGLAEARSGLTNAYNEAQSVTSEAQTAPISEQQIADFQARQQKLQSALGIYVNAVHEAYPELKADKTFLDLMTQLEGTENRISTERSRYNDAVKEYNIKVRRFPNSIFAGMFGFSVKVPFQADAEASKAPKVEF